MTFCQLLFIAGPSGVGKSELSKHIEEDLSFLHFDLDCHRPFEFHRLQRQWHQFNNQLDIEPLKGAICRRVIAADRSGAVLSFPSTRVLTRQQIDVARAAGICTVVLWGRKEYCMAGRRVRESKEGHGWNKKHYERSNRNAFEAYGCKDYADFRLEAFHPDGSFQAVEAMLVLVRERLAQAARDVP